jgi:superfamily I DNA/RNA helicase
VVAGPGTGKTFTAARRIGAIVDHYESAANIEAGQVLCLTFTNAATDVTKKRLRDLRVNSSNVQVTTLDKFAFFLRAQLQMAPSDGLGSYDENINDIVKAVKERQNLDYLLSVGHIIVDEAQDIFGTRRDLLDLFLSMGLDAGWTVFGDPAQTIYDYSDEDRAGSFLQGLIDQKKFDQSVLEIDHRAQNDDVRKIRSLGKELRDPTSGRSGIDLLWNSYRDLKGLQPEELVTVAAINSGRSPESVGVLFRTNREVLKFSHELAVRGVVHQLLNDRKEFLIPEWVANFERLTNKDEVLSVVPSFIEKESMSFVLEKWCHGGTSKKISLRNFAEALDEGKIPEIMRTNDTTRYQLSTVHRVKGMEFDKVYVGLNKNRLDENELEEARILFVGMTRSRKDVYRVETHNFVKNSRMTFDKRRWLDMEFKGKNQQVVTGVEVKMSDVNFEMVPKNLALGNEVTLRLAGKSEDGLPNFEVFDLIGQTRFATMKSDFCRSVMEHWHNKIPPCFVGLRISSFYCIVVPNKYRGVWDEDCFAKVPVIVGMAEPASGES